MIQDIITPGLFLLQKKLFKKFEINLINYLYTLNNDKTNIKLSPSKIARA